MNKCCHILGECIKAPSYDCFLSIMVAPMRTANAPAFNHVFALAIIIPHYPRNFNNGNPAH